jgi:hypothetical protein
MKFIELLQLLTTSKDYAFTVLHTSQITVTTEDIKSMQIAISSPVVAW